MHSKRGFLSFVKLYRDDLEKYIRVKYDGAKNSNDLHGISKAKILYINIICAIHVCQIKKKLSVFFFLYFH